MSLCKTPNHAPRKAMHSQSPPSKLLDPIYKANGDGSRSQPTRSLQLSDAGYFDSIVESSTSEVTRRSQGASKKQPDRSYTEIKQLLYKLLAHINEMEKQNQDTVNVKKSPNQRETSTIQTTEQTLVPSPQTFCPNAGNKQKGKKKKKEELSRTRWGHWTDWSSCSVSCGKGRQIRWRHCVEHCDDAETEMAEKACQLPACGPGKLFGVIQL